MRHVTKTTTRTKRTIGSRRQVVGLPSRGSFSSDIEYMLHLTMVRKYIDAQFRDTAKRFTNNLRQSRFSGEAK